MVPGVQPLVPIPQEVEDLGHRVIGVAITVHQILGPGFKERIYERAFCLELEEQDSATSARRESSFHTSAGGSRATSWT